MGIIAGAEAARRLRKINNKADPLICASSMFISALCLYIALMVAQTNILSTFVSDNSQNVFWYPRENGKGEEEAARGGFLQNSLQASRPLRGFSDL